MHQPLSRRRVVQRAPYTADQAAERGRADKQHGLTNQHGSPLRPFAVIPGGLKVVLPTSKRVRNVTFPELAGPASSMVLGR